MQIDGVWEEGGRKVERDNRKKKEGRIFPPVYCPDYRGSHFPKPDPDPTRSGVTKSKRQITEGIGAEKTNLSFSFISKWKFSS